MKNNNAQVPWYTTEALHDLVSGRGFALSLINEEKRNYSFDIKALESAFMRCCSTRLCLCAAFGPFLAIESRAGRFMSQHVWSEGYRAFGIAPQVDIDSDASLLSLLEQALQRFAGKPAFYGAQGVLSYAEIDRQSAALAAWLQHEVGVQRGDRIAVMLPNLPAFPVVLLGVLRAGCVQVSANPLYTPHELEHQLHDADCKAILVYSGSTATLSQVRPNPALARVITVGGGLPGSGETCQLPVAPELGAHIDLEQVLAEGRQLQRTPVSLCGEDLLFLQYTGGTTGLSKGARLSHSNLLANIAQYKAFMPSVLRPGEEVLVTAIPLYHIFALMLSLTYMSVGASNWLVANPRDMDGFIDLLKRAEPSVFMGVNTLYAGLLGHPRIAEVGFSSLRLSVGGGAAVQAAVSQRWQALTGTFIREGYGLSETAPVVSFNPEAIERFTGTTGFPVPGTDVLLLDENDQAVAWGESGEICVKGPQVMRGYWGMEQTNAQVFTADGYFRTGDIGQFDEQGMLKIVDRKKDMLIVSGFNVFPNEVEDAAVRHPALLECACVGVPDERTGEAVCLYVVRRTGAELDESTLIDHCRQHLAAYKMPKRIVFVTELPKSGVGKILRRKVRELAIA